MTPEEGSYRDRRSRVFYDNGRVIRALSTEALEEWTALEKTRFFSEETNAGRLIGTRRSTRPLEPREDAPGSWAGFLDHDLLPFISYPYEWTFGQLRDAAQLHLDLLGKALEEGFILQDASPYNVQFIGAEPIFIDIASFVRWKPGEPWMGYRQFCRLFLYPLLLQAHKHIPFQTRLRGSLDGISSEECARLFSVADFWRAGVFFDVFLQAKFEKKFSHTDRSIKKELTRAGFTKDMILVNIRRLSLLLEKLKWREAGSEWSHYAQERNYSSVDYQAKKDFVRQVSGRKRWRRVWDLGANTGDFSRLVAPQADSVVCLEGDPWVVEGLYREFRDEKNKHCLPLVMNLADPSPGLGWRGKERKSLEDRGKPDLVLCLALVHHMCLSANLPVKEWLRWMRSLGGELVIEFVAKTDGMVERLLKNKDDIYVDYSQTFFEAVLKELFVIEKKQELTGGHRVLYHAVPR